MANLHIDTVSKSFRQDDGGIEEVLDRVSFEADSGTFTTLIGPSGCGKTTLLNIIAGLLEPDGGVVKQNERPLRQSELECTYVFQEPRLLDWATVGENIKLALKARGVPKSKHDERIEKYLAKVDLSGETESYPQNLSGGMQQRVGIARALAVESEIMLMDEPFSSLDEITAHQLREDLLDIWRDTNKTIIFVTHDIRESIYLSDQILLMLPKHGIASRTEVSLSRPRDIEDPELLELESTLMTELAGKAGGRA